MARPCYGLGAAAPSRPFALWLWLRADVTSTVAELTVCFMADLPRLRRGAVLLFPPAHRGQAGRIADVLIDKVGA